MASKKNDKLNNIIEQLKTKPGQIATELARALGFTKSAAISDELESGVTQGLIRKEVEGRFTKYFVTDAVAVTKATSKEAAKTTAVPTDDEARKNLTSKIGDTIPVSDFPGFKISSKTNKDGDRLLYVPGKDKPVKVKKGEHVLVINGEAKNIITDGPTASVQVLAAVQAFVSEKAWGSYMFSQIGQSGTIDSPESIKVESGGVLIGVKIEKHNKAA